MVVQDDEPRDEVPQLYLRPYNGDFGDRYTGMLGILLVDFNLVPIPFLFLWYVETRPFLEGRPRCSLGGTSVRIQFHRAFSIFFEKQLTQ